MKYIFLIALFACCQFTYSQEKLEQLIKPGTKLMYRIDLNNKSYDMRVVVKKIDPFIFEYEVIDSANAKGTITHTKAGMKNGIVLHNDFTTGDKVLDDKTISGILSQKIFENLSKRKRRPVTIFLKGLSSEPVRIGFADREEDFIVRVNGKQVTIKQEYARAKIKFHNKFETTGENYFTYYNSAKLPLILKMRTGFYIELLDIINE